MSAVAVYTEPFGRAVHAEGAAVMTLVRCGASEHLILKTCAGLNEHIHLHPSGPYLAWSQH